MVGGNNMEVNVTKCVNNHYFDANKYSTCPHCGAVSSVATKTSEDKPEKAGRFNLFGKKKKSKDVEIIPVDTDSTDGDTFGLFNKEKVDSTAEKKPVKPISNDLSIEEFVIDDSKSDDFFDDITEGKIIKKVPDEINDDKPSGSLLEEVQSVTADNDGKTMGFFKSSTSTDRSLAVCDTDPVCGWLVCIKGKHFGKCFNIYSGSNSIGRTSSNRIVISDEESISREKHAWIIYEPRKREFYIKPGEGSGLTYLNEENILESKKLNSGDKLEFSETTAFAFMALCGEKFSWDNYITKE